MVKPLIISGPSGSGKTWLANYLTQDLPFDLLLSTTTRPPRTSEVNQVDADFVSPEQYEHLRHCGDLLTNLHFFGFHYGYRRSLLNNIVQRQRIPVVIFFTPTAGQLFPHFPPSVGIFLRPGSMSLLADRMADRGDTTDAIAKRLASAQAEIVAYDQYEEHYQQSFCINNDSDILPVIAWIKQCYNL